MEVDPTELSLLEDLGIDIVNHGAAVRVPEECITLRDEVVPDLQVWMEDHVRPLA
jgi:hypothetical protein